MVHDDSRLLQLRTILPVVENLFERVFNIVRRAATGSVSILLKTNIRYHSLGRYSRGGDGFKRLLLT